MIVTTGGTKGPIYRPVAPAPWRITPKVEGVSPTLATIGIRMGAMMALEPARVPSRDTSRVEVTMEIKMAIFLLFSLNRLITMYTRLCATLVRDSTSASPEPSTIMKPIRAQKEPRDA